MFERKRSDQNSIQGLSRNLREQVMSRGGIGLGVFCFGGTMVRNLVAPLKIEMTAVALLVGIFFLTIPFAIKRGASHRLCSFLMILAIGALAFIAGSSNGGLRAPFVTSVVLLPIFGFISSGRWGARIGFVLSASITSYFLVAEKWGVVFPLLHPERFIYYKGVIMYVSIMVTYMMGSIYEGFRDSSEEKLLHLSAELSQASKMSSLGEMASGISHEINNPLSIVIAKAELLRKKIDSGTVTTDTIKEDLLTIEKNGKRISKIILSMKRLSRNSDSDIKTRVVMSHIVEDVLEICRERFKNHQVDLGVEDHTSGVEVVCQSTQIAQVLVNLLGNAFDAVEKLPEKWVKLRMDLDGSSLLIAVTDSGKGIKKEVAEKMMQPFFTTKEVGKGTGLGLSISKGIIENHGGEFTYHASSPNTQFEIRLPLNLKS